jgi:hypothetical protein
MYSEMPIFIARTANSRNGWGGDVDDSINKNSADGRWRGIGYGKSEVIRIGNRRSKRKTDVPIHDTIAANDR